MGNTVDATTDEEEESELTDRIKSLVEAEFGSHATVNIYASGDTLDVEVKPSGVSKKIEQECDVDIMQYSDFKFTVYRD
jgi:hypothetical protein